MIQDNLNLGCVYFFKHNNLDCIKIGMSSNASPLKRFNSFLTYAPYGGEIIDFIITKQFEELELKLHCTYSDYRLNGEWFNISKSTVETIVNTHSNFEYENLKLDILRNIKNNRMDELDIELFNNIPLNTPILNDDFYQKYENSVFSKKEIKTRLGYFCLKNSINFNQKMFKRKGQMMRGFILS